MYLGGKYSFANLLKSGLRNRRELNHVLLGEFKLRDDVKMYIQLPYYYDFGGFGLPNGGRYGGDFESNLRIIGEDVMVNP